MGYPCWYSWDWMSSPDYSQNSSLLLKKDLCSLLNSKNFFVRDFYRGICTFKQINKHKNLKFSGGGQWRSWGWMSPRTTPWIHHNLSYSLPHPFPTQRFWRIADFPWFWNSNRSEMAFSRKEKKNEKRENLLRLIFGGRASLLRVFRKITSFNQ